MSEFYQSTPATTLFESENILLSGGRERDEETGEWDFDEVILYLDYDFETGTVGISIHDDETRSYLLQETHGSFPPALETLRRLAKEYPGKINVKAISNNWKIFFAVAPDIVVVDGRVSDYQSSCDTCGDYNTDEFNFLYVPSLPGSVLDRASLGLHWDYGCYGGEIIQGEFDSNLDDIRNMLETMLHGADSEGKGDIRRAMYTLETAQENQRP